MSHTNIQVAALSVTVSVIGVAALVAAAETGIDVRVEQWVRRMRMSPTERAEFDELETQIEQANQARTAYLEARQAENRAKFRADLLVAVNGRYVRDMTELTVPELVAEIAAVKQWLRTERQTQSYGATPEAVEHRAAIEARAGHLDALNVEFNARNDWRRKDITRLDRQRLRAGAEMVRDGSEWPNLPSLTAL
ncbi:hypothetical protein [Nocardia ignorata]|uniref:Uncharacterized protein n=1 Tax=Nocardia ignorata TaxID=145285 RepID=A0A4R6PM67_NOCIG|nr:hypothetical protein [Nocardia ignorata]TDP38753.1 hypothetical protein DFR75_103410 [Nocardia ignorata]